MGMREEMLAHTEFNTIHVRTAFRIAQAREKELLKELADLMEDYNLLSKDFAQLSKDKAALIAELRGLSRCASSLDIVEDIEALITKYESKT